MNRKRTKIFICDESKKLFVFFFALILVCGCEKKHEIKQPQVSTQQTLSTETKISHQPQTKNISQKSFYPVKKEEQAKPPAWLKEIASINNQYYDTWKEKSSKDSSTVLIASLTSSGTASSVSTQSTSSMTSSTRETTRPGYTPIVRRTETQPQVSSGSISRATSSGSISPSSSTSPSSQPISPTPSAAEDSSPKENITPQTPGVTVTRSIQPFTDGAYVRLNVIVSDNRVNGIIVTENIPESYTVANSTPSISKRTGNSIKWLFYGTSLTNQTITYELRGSGKATISGAFSSSLGSGSTTGDSQIGQ